MNTNNSVKLEDFEDFLEQYEVLRDPLPRQISCKTCKIKIFDNTGYCDRCYDKLPLVYPPNMTMQQIIKRQYYYDNKEKIDKKNKEWREKNKEKLDKKRKEKVECNCGITVAKGSLSRHKKSKRHNRKLNNIKNQKDITITPEIRKLLYKHLKIEKHFRN